MLFVLNVEGTYVDCVPADGSEPSVPVDELIGRSVGDILPREVAKGILDKIKRTLLTGHVQHLDYTLELPGGAHSYHGRFVPYARDEVIVIAVDKTAELEVEQEQGRRGGRDELADRVEQKMTAGAACSKLRFAGFRTNLSSPAHAYSAKERSQSPNTSSPGSPEMVAASSTDSSGIATIVAWPRYRLSTDFRFAGWRGLGPGDCQEPGR